MVPRVLCSVHVFGVPCYRDPYHNPTSGGFTRGQISSRAGVLHFGDLGFTHRPLSSSLLGLPYRILKINHNKELLTGPWVGLCYLWKGFAVATASITTSTTTGTKTISTAASSRMQIMIATAEAAAAVLKPAKQARSKDSHHNEQKRHHQHPRHVSYC